jgi:hypothetical protein
MTADRQRARTGSHRPSSTPPPPPSTALQRSESPANVEHQTTALTKKRRVDWHRTLLPFRRESIRTPTSAVITRSYELASAAHARSRASVAQCLSPTPRRSRECRAFATVRFMARRPPLQELYISTTNDDVAPSRTATLRFLLVPRPMAGNVSIPRLAWVHVPSFTRDSWCRFIGPCHPAHVHKARGPIESRPRHGGSEVASHWRRWQPGAQHSACGAQGRSDISRSWSSPVPVNPGLPACFSVLSGY